MLDLVFDIPTGMTAERLAQRFTALLGQTRGQRADWNRDGAHGPFRMRENSDESWQLDGTNDYWLHILDETRATLRCRYPREKATIEEVMDLFQKSQTGPTHLYNAVDRI